MMAERLKNDEWLTIAALGRKYDVGALYDAVMDSTVGGVLLWNENSAGKILRTPNADVPVVTIFTEDHADPWKDKILDIDCHTKASILANLVPIAGAAEYLNHPPASSTVCRVVVRYCQTGCTEKIEAMPPTFPWPTSATHVIAGITYGTQILFIFDRDINPNEQQAVVLEEMVNTLQMAFLGDATDFLDDDEADMCQLPDWVRRVKVTVFSDTPLQNALEAFEDVLLFVSSLRMQAEVDSSDSCMLPPAKFILRRVQVLPRKDCPVIPRQIPAKVTARLQSILTSLTGLTARCSAMQEELSSSPFARFCDTLEEIKNSITLYLTHIRQKIVELIPALRKGQPQEELVNLIGKHKQSPFQAKLLEQWMDERRVECQQYMDALGKRVLMFVPEQEIQLQFADGEVESLVVLWFTLPGVQDSFIKRLAEYAKNPGKKPLQNPSQAVTSRAQPLFESKLALFEHYSSHAPDSVKFIVSSQIVDDHRGIMLQHIKKSSGAYQAIELPAAPSTPTTVATSHNCVKLEWDPPSRGQQYVTSYSIGYAKEDSDYWQVVASRYRKTLLVVDNLEPDTSYVFKATAETEFGNSPCSPTCYPVRTLPVSEPRNLKLVKATSTSVSVKWDPPTCAAGIASYDVQYRKATETKHDTFSLEASQALACTLENLLPSTIYQVRIVGVCSDGKTSLPSETLICSTLSEWDDRLALRQREDALKVTEDEKPVILQIPMKETWSNKGGTLKKLSFGPRVLTHPHKRILLLGATGAGKTTLVNSMVNYIFGVEWKDEFRFKLIVNETTKSQAFSQTSAITSYELNCVRGFQIPFSLTIVDTPGFGDSRGIEHDHKTKDLIREFFSNPNGIDQIDAVCFVVEASRPRLTTSQKYVFDSILSIFGKDIKGNIVTLVTFADGQPPPVLAGIREAKLPLVTDAEGSPIYFKFNNSAIFPKSDPSQDSACNYEFNQMFWKMGMESMRRFFSSLNHFEPKSLLLTQEVLRERRRLEATLEGIQPQINSLLEKMDEMNKTQRSLEKYEADKAAYANFEYETEIMKPFQDDISSTGHFLTNCQRCNYTCHYPCNIANDTEKHGCAAMNRQGNDSTCTVCPGRCSWKDHFNMKYKWRYEKVKETHCYDDVKAKYEEATGKKLSTEEVVKRHQNEIVKLEEVLHGLLQQAAECNRRIQEISLHSNPLSTPEYIDLLIENEKQEREPGFMERIASLNKFREKAVLAQEVANPNPSSEFRKRTGLSDRFFSAFKKSCKNKTESKF